MNPFNQKRTLLYNLKKVNDKDKTITCRGCHGEFHQSELRDNLYVCPDCDRHFRLSASYRLKITLDKGSFKEFCGSLEGMNPLDFPGYDEKLEKEKEKTGLREGVITGTGKIHGNKAVVCAMDGRFMMGSMGSAVGEKITRAVEYATKKKLPLIIFSVSGGARMQEGIFSLFQMAKTTAAIEKHNQAGGLFISVMTNPTTGGVTASFASLGDIILAEPDALIGFAGPRVIKQTIGTELPEGFQKSEYLLEHGFVDSVIERKDMRDILGKILEMHKRGKHEIK